ncbi:MAG TPA: response regulator transcription factor [Methylomirabilota bacterium]|jgi:DNA-binding NarL/FixJ family response regulator|nr:response regulator transcription factor [Methylomirabilota bacterium]
MKDSLIRVLLVDDHALFRAGLRLLLAHTSGMEVVGEAADGREAVRVAKKTRPHVILMDIAMPGLNGLEATAQLSQECPESRVIVLSMHTNAQYVTQALRAGAAGYLLKDAAAAELEQAVKTVAGGAVYLTQAVSQQVIADYRRRLTPGKAGERAEEPFSDSLTPRQREILQLIAEGRTTKEIASLLHRSEKTIEAHRSRLMNQLDIHDLAGLVRYAIRIGLVSPEE